MKIITLTQASKPHNPNRLHDALIAANITPLMVESNADASQFTFDDAVNDGAIQAVITAYVLAAPTVPADIKNLWTTYRDHLEAASTVGQVKTVLTNDLGALLREILRAQAGSL